MEKQLIVEKLKELIRYFDQECTFCLSQINEYKIQIRKNELLENDQLIQSYRKEKDNRSEIFKKKEYVSNNMDQKLNLLSKEDIDNLLIDIMEEENRIKYFKDKIEDIQNIIGYIQDDIKEQEIVEPGEEEETNNGIKDEFNNEIIGYGDKERGERSRTFKKVEKELDARVIKPLGRIEGRLNQTTHFIEVDRKRVKMEIEFAIKEIGKVQKKVKSIKKSIEKDPTNS